MAVKKILSSIDSAFVKEEESVPRYLHKVLGSIESWLKEESKQETSFELGLESQSHEERKLALLMRVFAKQFPFVALLKAENKSNYNVELSMLRGSQKQGHGLAMGRIALEKDKWQSMGPSKAIKFFPELKMLPPKNLLVRRAGSKHLVVIYCPLHDAGNSDLLLRAATQIDRIG